MARLGLEDTPTDMLVKMSDGNPGGADRNDAGDGKRTKR